MNFAIRLLAAALAVLPVAALADTAPAPLTAETMWQLKRVGAPAISPDGKFAVYDLKRYDADTDKGNSDLYLVPTAGGKPQRLTSSKGNETEPTWSPDGRFIAFVAKRGDDKQPQLYVIAANGGEATRVSNADRRRLPSDAGLQARGRFITEVWPDITDWAKTKEKMTQREEWKMSAMTWDRPPVTHWDHFIEDRIPHLYSVAIDGATPVAITLDSGQSLPRRENGKDSYDISPDGREIAFVANTDTTGRDENTDVYVVPATGGAAKNLTADNPAGDESPSYSPDGRYLAYSMQTIKGFYGDTSRLVDRESDHRRRRRGLGPLGQRHLLGAPFEVVLRAGRRRGDRAHLPLRRREGHAARADDELELQFARDRRQARDPRRTPAILHRTADTRRRLDQGRRRDQALRPQR